jgi:hypothetical protein
MENLMPEKTELNILNFISTRPEILLLIALTGALCVIGVADYLRCFFERKHNMIRWVVLFLSLFVAITLSPVTPAILTTIIILWLLILALATIGKKAIIDGIPALISMIINKISGISANNQGGK